MLTHTHTNQFIKYGFLRYWILAVGGIGMGLGLFVYGYKIIRAIGVKLVKVTPSRGFSIELGAAIVIIFGSYLGIPLSTTHCQVGATAGVGILEGTGGVNKRTLLITVLGWILTLVVAGVGTGLLTAQGVYAPSVESLHDDDTPF
jgi:sodium-dependent phosphate transporter